MQHTLRLRTPVELERLRFIAAAGLIVLNIFDLAVTRIALAAGAAEANPLMAPIVTSGWGLVVKVGLPFGVALLHLSRPPERRHVFALCWVSVLYMYVVAWNTHVLTA